MNEPYLKTYGPLGGAGKAEAGKTHRPGAALEMAAIGLEAECTLWVDGRKATPERVFGDPRAFLAGPLVHREGTSYHLPTGGAVYFDTGVVEVATPAIEIAYGCAARAGRSLWEGLHAIRDGLDAWERRTGREARLQGFSAHYNISFEAHGPRPDQSVEALAWLLAHILPAPVMLVAANRQSTGVGVRPRGNRVEVTVDFTPAPALSIATAALVTGIVREVMTWPSYSPAMLDAMAIPTVAGFRPIPHTSRKGWLAHATSWASGNPFEAGTDAPIWKLSDAYARLTGDARPYHTLRHLAEIVFRRFLPAIQAVAHPFTLRLLMGIMSGHAPALLDLPARPDAYDDVGRACRWDALFSERQVRRSQYEVVFIHALRGDVFVHRGTRFTPVRPRGWSEVVFRDGEGRRRVFTLDFLVRHAAGWRRR